MLPGGVSARRARAVLAAVAMALAWAPCWTPRPGLDDGRAQRAARLVRLVYGRRGAGTNLSSGAAGDASALLAVGR